MGKFLGVMGASAFCALLACSSTSTPGASAAAASCGKVMPCGGSVVGTWTIAAACSSGTVMTPSGTGCTITESLAASPSFTGTETFNADGTISSNVGGSIGITLNVPAACLSQGGTTVTCAQLQTSLSGSFGDSGAGASCSMAGTGCTCTTTMSTPAMMTSGTYTTMGNNITTTTNSGTSTPSTASYCVVGGNTLHLMPTASLGMGSMGTMGVTVDIVLTK